MKLFPTGHATHPQWRMAAALVLAESVLRSAIPLVMYALFEARIKGTPLSASAFFADRAHDFLAVVLLLLGVLVGSGGRFGGESFALLLLLNPADVFRILNVFSLEDVRTLYGLATVVPPAMGSPLKMGGAMLVWIAVPLALAHWRFKP